MIITFIIIFIYNETKQGPTSGNFTFFINLYADNFLFVNTVTATGSFH